MIFILLLQPTAQRPCHTTLTWWESGDGFAGPPCASTFALQVALGIPAARSNETDQSCVTDQHQLDTVLPLVVKHQEPSTCYNPQAVVLERSFSQGLPFQGWRLANWRLANWRLANWRLAVPSEQDEHLHCPASRAPQVHHQGNLLL